MPGETTATPLMPGGYKPEILASTGGRIGYAKGSAPYTEAEDENL